MLRFFAWLLLLCQLASCTSAETAIPRLLHQVSPLPSLCPQQDLVEVVPGKLLHKALANIITQLRERNPSWKYLFWDHQDISQLLRDQRQQLHADFKLRPYEDMRAIYDSINPHYGAARADFFRYIVVYIFGGVYLDLKSFCHFPLNELLQPEDRLVLAEWDEQHFPGWSNWGDLIPGRGKEYVNWFFASVPRHPALHKTILRMVANYRQYSARCLDSIHESHERLLYRFKNDSSFNRSHWPRNRFECSGQVGTLVLTGPIAFTNAIVAASLDAGSVAEELHVRVIPTNNSRDLVYDFGPTDVGWGARQQLFCGGPTYRTLREPIYLPLRASVAVFQGRTRIVPESAASP